MAHCMNGVDNGQRRTIAMIFGFVISSGPRRLLNIVLLVECLKPTSDP